METGEKRFVYADNSATTRLCDEAFLAMKPYLTEEYGNPSSIYSFANNARRAVAAAREKVASVFCAAPGEIYFTSGGTESNNTAIFGAARASIKKGRHIITSAIEHHAVLHPLQRLEKEGYLVTYLPVDEYGSIDPEKLKAAIRPDTVLITVMTANNEVGTIQPISEIGKIAREHGVLFHTDAVQAAGHIPLNVGELNVDMMSISAHKFNGPKGVGALYVKKGVRIGRLLEGGGQERSFRSGTENVAGIVGLAAALESTAAHMEQENKRLCALREKLINGILKIPATRLTGHPENRLPGLCSVVIEYIEGESLVLLLDMNGICASTGSACSTGSLDPSHVLMAMGLPHEVAHGSLRLSLGRYQTEQDVDYILDRLPKIVERLRDMSPVWPG